METHEELQNKETDEMQEGKTPAADTLKPKGAPGESKAKTLAAFTQLLSQLGKEDLTDFFSKTQAQYGKNKTPGAVDKAASNRDTVDMKPSAAKGKGPWKEDIEEMFSGDELNEEQQEQIETVFEAAINTRLTVLEAEMNETLEEEKAKLEEEFATRLEEETSEMFESLSGKLDQYLDYVVENWLEENKVEVESSLRVDIAENFIDSLHTLFTEHYVKVPETKLDVVADLNKELDLVKEELDAKTDEILELRTIAEKAEKAEIIGTFTEGLTDLEADKLSNLAENLDFSDAETYGKKVGILKEKYFSVKQKDTGILTEEIAEGNEEETQEIDPGIAAAAAAISARKNG